ncbi:MAG TPA: ribosome maturation factor RimM, partial [Candidatus Limnocylindria bacterium]|nr:ribosome maturation factor RimM [Candidatus Limnocylindria bacterium]
VSALRGRHLRVSREAARAAARGRHLWADLVGLDVVTPDGTTLGSVRELLRAGGADVLVVIGPDAGERLLPMIDSVVRSVDIAERRIVVTPQEEL